MPPKILVIVGPTASGKTRLAVELAHEWNGEVVSADSMQVYRRMDIGTAKPTAEEMDGIPHHMIDVADPGEDFSAALCGWDPGPGQAAHRGRGDRAVYRLPALRADLRRLLPRQPPAGGAGG